MTITERTDAMTDEELAQDAYNLQYEFPAYYEQRIKTAMNLGFSLSDALVYLVYREICTLRTEFRAIFSAEHFQKQQEALDLTLKHLRREDDDEQQWRTE